MLNIVTGDFNEDKPLPVSSHAKPKFVVPNLEHLFLLSILLLISTIDALNSLVNPPLSFSCQTKDMIQALFYNELPHEAKNATHEKMLYKCSHRFSDHFRSAMTKEKKQQQSQKYAISPTKTHNGAWHRKTTTVSSTPNQTIVSQQQSSVRVPQVPEPCPRHHQSRRDRPSLGWTNP